MPNLETERLLLRKIVVTDAPFFYKLFNSDGWLTYIGDRNIRTVADAEKQLVEKYIPSYAIHGYGSYVVVDKSSNVAVGTCGVYKRENLDHPDLGFAFLPAFTRKGFGYEASQVVLDHTKKQNELKEILAFTLPQNIPSIKLLEKLGFKNKGSYQYEKEGEELLLFSMVQ